MNESLYEVAFSGQIQEGAELDAVKARIAKMFKANEATMAKLFSGRRIVIKRNLSAEAADKYSMAFTKVGAICELELMSADTAPPAPADNRAATKTPATASAAPADRSASSNQGFRKIAAISGIAVGVVAALVAATPYVTGILAEQRYQDGMALFQDFAMQQSGAFTVKSDVDYQRGWLSSTVVNTVTIEVPERDPVTFELNSNISHGPLLLSGPKKFGLAAIETNMPLSAAQKADMARIWKGNENPIQVHSHIDFDGKTLTEVSIAGFTLDNIDNDPASKLNFETMSTTVTVSDNFTRTDADMAWNGMQLDTPDAKVVVGKLTGHSEKHLSVEGLWLGGDEFNLSSVSVNVSGALADTSGQMPSSSTIEKLGISAHSEVDSSSLVKGHATITVKDVVVENKSVASDIKLTIAMERLQAKALQSIAQKMSEHQKRALQSGNPGQTPDLSLIQGDVSAILAAGPVLKITTLQATTEHGKVEADLEATIKVDDLAALQNPMFLMMAMQAAGNISVPARLIESTPLAVFAPGFIDQGYIKNEQGQLKTTMKFRQGQLTLNGKTLQQ
ncbi:MAG: YdgA family protein [Gammaproteobacteria bacterium]|nr:YdgA family protein [Gammaproteobacteria bacterium]